MPVAFGLITPDLLALFVLWLVLLSFGYFYLAYRFYDQKIRHALHLISLSLGIVMVGAIYIGVATSLPNVDRDLLPMLGTSIALTSFFFAFLGFSKIEKLAPLKKAESLKPEHAKESKSVLAFGKTRARSARRHGRK